MLLKHTFVEMLLTRDLVLMASKSIFPSLLFRWGTILNDSWVLVWLDVAAVVEGFHDRWRWLCQSRACNALTIVADFTFLGSADSSRSCVFTVDGANHTLAFSNHVILHITVSLNGQIVSVLLKQFARNEREELKLLFFRLRSVEVSFQLVFNLLLVIEEEELVLQNLAASHFDGCIFLITVSHSGQVLPILIYLHATLCLLIHQVLPHLSQMILKQVFVVWHAPKVDPFTKLNQVCMLLFDRDRSVSFA